MSKFILIFILALVSCDFDINQGMFEKFQKFIRKYNKKYNSINEFLARFEVFKINVIDSLKENESSYSKGINQFFDLTQQEFTKMYLNFYYDAFAAANFNPYHMEVSNAAPEAFDWRDKKAVAPVVDPLSYSTSAISVTLDNLQSLYYINKGKLVIFSEQMIIDCVSNIRMISYIFSWLKENGIESDIDYPYKSYKGTCMADPSKYIDMIIRG